MVVLSNFLVPQDGIRHEEAQTTLYINEREVGKGTLYITESLLSWVNNSTRQGFSLEYPHISLHAISRDEQVHSRQCLYVMVDAKVDFPESTGSNIANDNHLNNDNEADDSSDPAITEMRFAPDNTLNLDAMFVAMNECQALHPDPQDSFSDEEEVFEDAEQEEYPEAGAEDVPYILPADQVASHNGTEQQEDSMDVEAGQFEDAEGDP